MKRWMGLLSLVLLWMSAQGAFAADAAQVVINGKADRDVPAWTIRTVLPAGWTQDCCLYAQGIGVNEVLYKGEWTGEPDRVMVLNVWPSKLSSLEAEVQDDRHHYLARDPHGKAGVFELDNKALACRGLLYEGTDHKDDVVVFCDPGLASGIRLSWSMAFAHDEPGKDALLALFRQVVEQSRYAVNSTGHADAAKAAH
ncbi:hypothetical protein [Dyella amyloliquefaciens]|uniref:hypothetical protein n=1 Tax=Dyella amyloliquefaciens TaxID=1770545 RepID=UPI00102E6EAC|nr:hypothetical protein [Dyella amyloliquefaciens]